MKVPFNPNGDLRRTGVAHDTVWKDLDGFSTRLEIEGVLRSAASGSSCFVLKDAFEHKFYMFITEVADMLKYATISNGYVDGYWTFIRRGLFYGIKWNP